MSSATMNPKTLTAYITSTNVLKGEITIPEKVGTSAEVPKEYGRITYNQDKTIIVS